MKAPHFSLPDQDGKTASLDSFRGKKLLLYFYPKADTPGCTAQACGLRDTMGPLKASGVAVVGVSPDDVADLKHFEEKYSLPFTLLADPTTKTLQAYGVWGEKTFMGRHYMGVMRTTFLIDEDGNIIKKYSDVNPHTHADMLLADIRALGRANKVDAVKTVRKIPMQEPSRKSPTKQVDKKIRNKAAVRVAAAPKTAAKKLAVKKVAKKKK